jgi:WD40 repeat protein/serine/threonine protein kinase/tetratricopeptide (TPR) repeat protein
VELPRRLGEFELLSELGRGGMGVVYRAWQPSLGRQVALKSLIRAGDPKAEARFNREIHALGRVEHPHLVKVFTSGAESDRWFYAMELIEGATLGAVCGHLQSRGSSVTELDLETWQATLSTACQEARAAEKPLSADEHPDDRTGRSRDVRSPASAAGRDYIRHVVELVRQVAEAAHALHESGVIHRDIKPDNVLVTPDGTQAVLMDLGLAQLADEAEGRLTRTRQFVGTLRYASPEQVLSVPLDRRSDVYSLGVTLWELLTLRPMFGATDQTPTPDLMLKVQQTDPESPRRLNPRVPQDLESIVLKCLEKDRSRRYASAQDLADDLSRWLRGELVLAQPPTIGYRLVKTIRRHRVALAMASVLLVALMLGCVAAVLAPYALSMRRLLTQAEGALKQVDKALQSEAEARQKAEGLTDSLKKASGELEKAREELRVRLVEKVDIVHAIELMDQGDLFGSLAWFADVHRLEEGDRERDDRLRMRLNAILQHGPRLDQVFFHGDMVSHDEFSPDGRRVITAGSDNTAQVWDAATGQPVTNRMKHQGIVYWATFSPDGRRAVTASQDGTARAWDAATGQATTEPLRHAGSVSRGAFSPDGRRVITASEDGTARVWDAATGRPVTEPLKHGGPVGLAAFSADGLHILTDARDGIASLWDAATGQPVTPRMKHEGRVIHAAFTPNGPRVITAGVNHVIRVLDAATGQPVTPPMMHEADVNGAQFSPDGRRIVTASDDRTARVWDLASGKPVTGPLKHRGSVNVAAFSPDGRSIITASENTARMWRVVDGQPMTPPLRHGGSVYHAAFSPDGRRVLTASSDGTARSWDRAPGQPFTPPLKHEDKVRDADFSPDSRLVVSAGDDGTARVWDAATSQPLAPAMTHRAPVSRAEFSPDGRRVVTVSTDRTARVWNTATGEPITQPLDHEQQVRYTAFSPDSRRVVTVSDGGIARVWDATTGQSATPPTTVQGKVDYAIFSPDSLRLATAGSDHAVRIWDTVTGHSVTPPMKHDDRVSSLAFSPDGRLIVTVSSHEARVWNAVTGDPITPPMKHEGPVRLAVFSPDALLVLTRSDYSPPRVWDAASGQSVTTIPSDSPLWHPLFGYEGRRLVAIRAPGDGAWVSDVTADQPLTPPMKVGYFVYGARLSPDGRRVVTLGGDHTARVWDTATSRPIQPRENGAKDLIALAHMLSRSYVASNGALVPLRDEELRTRWQDLRPRYPEVFTCSDQEILSWHWREAAGCEEDKVWDWAVKHFDALLKTDPESWMLFCRRARAYYHLSRWNGAIADATKAIALRPEQDQLWKLQGFWHLRGAAHAELGQWKQAASDLAQATEEHPGYYAPQADLALVHLAAGDLDKYRAACERLLREFGKTEDPNVAHFVDWACVLAPNAVADWAAVVRCAEAAVKAASDESAKDAFFQTLSAATYRAGRSEESVKHANEGLPVLDDDPLKCLFQAMVLHRLGRVQDAKDQLLSARASLRKGKEPPSAASPNSGIDWRTRLAYRVLRNEAEGLINGSGNGPQKRTDASPPAQRAKKP